MVVRPPEGEEPASELAGALLEGLESLECPPEELELVSTWDEGLLEVPGPPELLVGSPDGESGLLDGPESEGGRPGEALLGSAGSAESRDEVVRDVLGESASLVREVESRRSVLGGCAGLSGAPDTSG